MENMQQLKEIISNYWQFDRDAIDWETEFNSQQLKNFTSLRMLRFLASVEERFAIHIEDVDSIKRFADLLRVVDGRDGSRV